MRMRSKLLLLVAVTTLPFLAALPLVLRQVQQTFERQLGERLDGTERSAEAALVDLGSQVERSVRELAHDAALEEVALAVREGAFDYAKTGERLMALSGLEVLTIYDDEGRVLTSGHLPARAGDLEPAAVAQGQGRPGGAFAQRVEIRSDGGIVPGLAVVASASAEHGGLRLHLVGGRLLGSEWARRLSQLTGAAVSVHEGDRELARAGRASGPRGREIAIPSRGALRAAAGEPVEGLGTVRVELSSAPLEQTRSAIVRGAIALWLALLLAGMGLGLVTAARISRPIDALAGAARRLARGELGHRVEVRAGGELGELVDSFNAMSADLRSATDRAMVAERVAAWQGVARRLAHEIKNPLTPIRLSMETLRAAHRARREDFGEIFEESAGAILEEVERLRRIVDEFSRFARLPKPRLAPADLSEVASGVLALWSEPRDGVVIERELAGELPVQVDRDQIAQVLINLLTNAEQAMPGGGRILVRTRALQDGEVALEVADQGPGIPPEARAHLFEPYFTTKSNGTGLGLAIAQRIAQEHGGRLEEVGTPGQGACFRLVVKRQA